MKVLHITNTQFFAEKLLKNKLEGLCRSGHDIHLAFPVVAAPSLPFPCHDTALPRGISPRRCAGAAKELTKLIQTEGFDLVHTHSSIGGIVGRYAARKAGTRCIHTVHGFPFYKGQCFFKYALYRTIEKRAARRCDALLFQSREELELARSLRFDCPLIYEGNGIDLESILPRETPTKQRGQPFVFGVFARLEPVKGHFFFLKSFERLAKQYPAVHAVFYGSAGAEFAKYRDRLLRTISTAPFVGKVHYKGFADDVMEPLRSCDALVLPSRKEGIPRVVMEAMALGVPVIATDVCGTRELIYDQSTGLSVPYGNTAALARAMERMYLSVRLREYLALRARDFIVSCHDEKFVIDRLVQAYSHMGVKP